MKVTNLFTEKDREVFDRIDRDCLAMHVVPPPKTFLKLEVRNGAGELTDVYEDRAHSWVRNMYNRIYTEVIQGTAGAVYGQGSLLGKDINGSNISNAFYVYAWECLAPINNDSYGILIGRGASEFSLEDYNLTTKITKGTSANQMVYGAVTATTPVYDSVSKKWTRTISRVFNNNSGNEIVVSEVGLAYYSPAASALFARDLLAEVDWKTIPNAGQLTVTYTIEMTFPA